MFAVKTVLLSVTLLSIFFLNGLSQTLNTIGIVVDSVSNDPVYDSVFVAAPFIHALENQIRLFPNPLDDYTTIRYSLKESGRVIILLYNIYGEEIKEIINRNKSKGVYNLRFNATELPVGIYFYTYTVSENMITKRMVILRN